MNDSWRYTCLATSLTICHLVSRTGAKAARMTMNWSDSPENIVFQSVMGTLLMAAIEMKETLVLRCNWP